MTTIRRVAILGGNRIPFARSNTVYSQASNQEMFTATLQGLVDRFNLHGERLGDVVDDRRRFRVIKRLVGRQDANLLQALFQIPYLRQRRQVPEPPVRPSGTLPAG